MEVQAFKDELGQRREVEQQLRREVRELKAKLEYCAETMNKVKEKAEREREMAEEEIRQLREGF
jgi:chromosome segregation ATPase